jgi:hypothetical protein
VGVYLKNDFGITRGDFRRTLHKSVSSPSRLCILTICATLNKNFFVYCGASSLGDAVQCMILKGRQIF